MPSQGAGGWNQSTVHESIRGDSDRCDVVELFAADYMDRSSISNPNPIPNPNPNPNPSINPNSDLNLPPFYPYPTDAYLWVDSAQSSEEYATAGFTGFSGKRFLEEFVSTGTPVILRGAALRSPIRETLAHPELMAKHGKEPMYISTLPYAGK